MLHGGVSSLLPTDPHHRSSRRFADLICLYIFIYNMYLGIPAECVCAAGNFVLIQGFPERITQ